MNTIAPIADEPSEQPGIKLSLKAITFAGFLFSMTMSVQVGKVTGSTYLGGGVLAAGLFLLLALIRPSRFVFANARSATIMAPLLGLSLVFASSVYSTEISSLIKVLLLIALFYAVASRVPSLSPRDLLTGAMLFAAVDFLFVIATRSEWNPNTFCNHIAFATLCGTAGAMNCRKKLHQRMAWAWLAAGLAINFLFASRTAVIGMLACVGLYYAILRGRMSRVAFVYIFVIGAATTFFWSGDIAGGIADLAKQNLGSNNVIARFFLEDKTEKKIDKDFFDRERVWRAAYQTTLRNPWLGIGYDQPLFRRGHFRAHNAYLEIGYQCGIIAMIVWTLVYLGFVDYSMTKIPQAVNAPLVFMAFTSSCYLVLAGLMESSGIMSIATPGNWVAISAIVSLKSQSFEDQPYQAS